MQDQQKSELEFTIEPLNKFDELTEREIVDMAKTDTLAISYLYRQHYGAIHWRSTESTEQPTTSAADDAESRLEPMRMALLALPLAIQSVLTLHCFEDLPIDSIAKIMKCRPGTVKSRLSRGKAWLRTKLTVAQENSNQQRPIGSLLKKSEV